MASTGRERRKTAGRRMSVLVGKAQEEDDAFWGHDTWNEDDSDNESFRESEEDSDLAKDEFDSDFDESESDNEDEEAAAGEAAELELQQNERAAKQARKGGVYMDKKAVGGPGKKRQRRIMGEGSNAGVVLNFPKQMADSLAMQQQLMEQQQQSTTTNDATAAVVTSLFLESAPSTSTEQVTELSLPSPQQTPMEVSPLSPTTKPTTTKRAPKTSDPVLAKSTLVSTRERRSTHGVRKLRDTRSTPAKNSATASNNRRGANQHTTGKAATTKRKRYTQEELLIEAVHETEPENKRWLLARKRVQDQNEKDANANALRNQQRGKVIQKFHSRRGCLITLTFPEMDAVPEILTRRPQQVHNTTTNVQSATGTNNGESEDQTEVAYPASLSTPKNDPTKCVITGKPARYRDPLTKSPYYDVAAFKELRRRHDAGLHIDQTSAAATTQAPNSASSNPDATTGTSEADTKPRAIQSATTNQKPTPPSSTTQKPAKKMPAKRPSAKSTGAKKTSPASSKLPFQSPKPDPPQIPSAASNPPNSSSATSAAKPDSSLAHLAFSWGNGGTPGQSSTESPISPSGRRLSRRKWKPSEKVLQTIAMSPKKDGVTNTPPGLMIKPQLPLTENIPMMPPPPSIGGSVSATTTQPQQPDVKAKNTANTKSADRVPIKRQTTTAKKKPGETKAKKDAVSHPSSVAAAKTVATTAAAMSPPASAVTAHGKRSADGTLKIPSPELAKQLQNVYVVPPNGTDNSALNGDYAENSPQYITQGDLINQVINDYTKRHEGEQKGATGDKQASVEQNQDKTHPPDGQAP
jgi:hypothetical protein